MFSFLRFVLRGLALLIEDLLRGSARLGEEVNKNNPDIRVIRKELEDAREQYQRILEKLNERKDDLKSKSPACLDTLISTVLTKINVINKLLVLLSLSFTPELKTQIIEFVGTTVEFTNSLQDCYSKNTDILRIWP